MTNLYTNITNLVISDLKEMCFVFVFFRVRIRVRMIPFGGEGGSIGLGTRHVAHETRE